ncbi:hypothetical protein OK351_03805 [Glutamicibacter sp. MNS18]|uniref:hypothetical protein n=1 Tax=Glutamicibacter sp. MNS18 TaxID=2989817 RepID=UPI002235AF35|nr:hypothetical protein [Glutamicibacter sp. MNS18]MCW4464633.1 hypothetical protein [Glutamicibacter sp. MNS18]
MSTVPTIEQLQASLQACQQQHSLRVKECATIQAEAQQARAEYLSLKEVFEAGDFKLAPKVADAKAVSMAYTEALGKAEQLRLESAKRQGDAQAELERVKVIRSADLLTGEQIAALLAEAQTAIDGVLSPYIEALEAHAAAYAAVRELLNEFPDHMHRTLGIHAPGFAGPYGPDNGIEVRLDEGVRHYSGRSTEGALSDVTRGSYGRYSESRR